MPETKASTALAKIDQARKMKGLEKENARLKRIVADLTLGNSILKEAAQGNF